MVEVAVYISMFWTPIYRVYFYLGGPINECNKYEWVTLIKKVIDH